MKEKKYTWNNICRALDSVYPVERSNEEVLREAVRRSHEMVVALRRYHVSGFINEHKEALK